MPYNEDSVFVDMCVILCSEQQDLRAVYVLRELS